MGPRLMMAEAMHQGAARTILLLAIAAVVAAPALAKSVHPRSLAPAKAATVHRLAADHVFTEKAATFTLGAGDYVETYEDRGAVYLIGDGECLRMKVVPPKNPAAAHEMRFPCGIMLPRDPARGAAFFTIRGHIPASRENGVLINAIIASGEGKFLFPTSRRDDMRLRRLLVPVDGPPTAGGGKP